MNFKTIILLFICVVQYSWAQKDAPIKTTKLKLNWDQPTFVEPTSSSAGGIQYKSIIEKSDSYLKKYAIINKDKPTESILVVKSEFKNPGDIYRDKLNKEIGVGSSVDVFFGKFKVNTPRIFVRTRDHMDPDGDKVRIILNNVVVVLVVTLESSFKTNSIDLREGDNLLDILALNQGWSGPNTATFALYDANNNLITTNDWNLSTGLAAKFIIEYVKPLEENK
jgi:hypothetical protein